MADRKDPDCQLLDKTSIYDAKRERERGNDTSFILIIAFAISVLTS